jgi:GTP-binding protein Era
MEKRSSDKMEQPGPGARRCGVVAIVGRTNTGKSTLINRILDEKVSIVSPVVQTTRNLVRGIYTDDRGQLVFLDTPGLHKAQGHLGRIMNRKARAALEGADVHLLVFDASARPHEEDEGWIRRLLREEAACVVVLNKTDLGARHTDDYRRAWDRIAGENNAARPATWRPASALTGEGVPDVVEHLLQTVPVGPLLFPEDLLTDFPRRLNMADLIREQYLGVLRQELPHAIAVWIEDIEEGDQGWMVRGFVYVRKHSQKGIVIGKKGRLLRSVRRAAEAELTEMYQRPVTLDLRVKVEKDWDRNFWFLKRLGYVD